VRWKRLRRDPPPPGSFGGGSGRGPLFTAACIAAIAIAACAAPPTQPEPFARRLLVAARRTLPAGAELLPDDAAKPGEAKPQAVVVAGGNLWIFLTNLARLTGGGYAPASPSYAVVLDPATLDTKALVRLERDGKRCLNAGYAKAAGDRILVACAADFAGAGALAEISIADRTVLRVTPVEGAPGSLLASGPVVWMGDLAGGKLIGIEPETGTIRTPVEVCPLGAAPFEMVGDVALAQGRAFAACFGRDQVVEFDVATGQPLGPRLDVGDGPIAFARATDSLWVLDNLGSTLSRVRPGPPAAALAAVLALGQTPTGVDAHGTLLAIANSTDGTVTLLDATGPAKLDSADLKHPGDGTPYPWGVAFGEDAVFVALNGPGEVVRVELLP